MHGNNEGILYAIEPINAAGEKIFRAAKARGKKIIIG